MYPEKNLRNPLDSLDVHKDTNIYIYKYIYKDVSSNILVDIYRVLVNFL